MFSLSYISCGHAAPQRTFVGKAYPHTPPRRQKPTAAAAKGFRLGPPSQGTARVCGSAPSYRSPTARASRRSLAFVACERHLLATQMPYYRDFWPASLVVPRCRRTAVSAVHYRPLNNAGRIVTCIARSTSPSLPRPLAIVAVPPRAPAKALSSTHNKPPRTEASSPSPPSAGETIAVRGLRRVGASCCAAGRPD